MVGLLKMWRVSGLTTEAAQASETLHELGRCMTDPLFFQTLHLHGARNRALRLTGKRLIGRKPALDSYLQTGDKELHDEAVRFLVMVAAVMQGSDGMPWDWQAIRHFSQGLYGSMMDNRLVFESQNSPLIDGLIRDVDRFLKRSAS